MVLKGLVYRGAKKLKGLVDIRLTLLVALCPLFSSSLALDFSQYKVVAFLVDAPCLRDISNVNSIYIVIVIVNYAKD